MTPTPTQIDKIKEVKDLQARKVNQDHVRNLIDAINKAQDPANKDNTNIKQPPPIVLFKVTDRDYGDFLILVDGWHRLHARIALKQDMIYAYIHTGTYQDALDYSIHANTEHGNSLSREDRRTAVQKLLKFNPVRSNNWISEIAGVSDKMVKDYRIKMEQNEEIPIVEQIIGKDGKEYDSNVNRDKLEINLRTTINFASRHQQRIFIKAIEHIYKVTGSEKLNYAAECMATDYLSGAGEDLPELEPETKKTKIIKIENSLF